MQREYKINIYFHVQNKEKFIKSKRKFYTIMLKILQIYYLTLYNKIQTYYTV